MGGSFDDARRLMMPDVRHCFARVALAAAIALLVPRLAIAQPTAGLPLSQILPDLIGNTIVLAPRSTPEVPSHAAHFKPSPEQLQTPEQFNQQMVTLLSTFPFGSSSGGLHLRSVARDLQPQQRKLRAALRRAGADDRAGSRQPRRRLSALDLRHLRRQEPAAARDQLLHPAHRLLRQDPERRPGPRRVAAESGLRG